MGLHPETETPTLSQLPGLTISLCESVWLKSEHLATPQFSSTLTILEDEGLFHLHTMHTHLPDLTRSEIGCMYKICELEMMSVYRETRSIWFPPLLWLTVPSHRAHGMERILQLQAIGNWEAFSVIKCLWNMYKAVHIVVYPCQHFAKQILC